MHQIKWIRFYITEPDFGQADWDFKHDFLVQWYLFPVLDAVDSFGVLLMGGEL